jgi:hypothetical protein
MKENSKKKSYQKPVWEKQRLFERFSMACCLKAGGCAVKTVDGAHPNLT